MLQIAQVSLLWFSAIGCAVIGGVYFTFSTFVMPAFATIDRAAAMSAMQAINDVILRSLFMPLFMGTTLATAALAVLALLQWSAPEARWILAGSLLYVIGMFVVTAVFNVPLNNALASTSATSAEAAGFWANFLRSWNFWNHIRTVTSIAASLIFILVLVRG